MIKKVGSKDSAGIQRQSAFGIPNIFGPPTSSEDDAPKGGVAGIWGQLGNLVGLAGQAVNAFNANRPTATKPPGTAANQTPPASQFNFKSPLFLAAVGAGALVLFLVLRRK